MAVLKEYQKREEEFLRRAKDLGKTTAGMVPFAALPPLHTYRP